jgi:hypothetical protein
MDEWKRRIWLFVNHESDKRLIEEIDFSSELAELKAGF